MKKYLSVFGLALQLTMKKLLLITFFCITSQAALFIWGRQSGLMYSNGEAYNYCGIIFGICFCLFMVVLSMAGCNRKNVRTSYTFMRMRLNEKTIVSVWALHNTLWLFAFWAAEAALLFFLGEYALTRPTGGGIMNGFVGFYTNSFLHSVIPMAEITRIIRNIAFCISLGTASALFSSARREGMKASAAPVTAGIAVVFFARNMGTVSMDIALALFMLLISGTAAYNRFSEAMRDED